MSKWCDFVNKIKPYLNVILIFIIASGSIIGIVFLIIFLISLVTASNKEIKQMDFNNIHKDRIKKCLTIYEKYYPVIIQKPITKQYFSPQYNKMKDYGLRDYFYACSYKSYQPCGNTFDVVSYNAISNVISKGARGLNLDLFFKSATNNPFADDARIIVGNVVTTDVVKKDRIVQETVFSFLPDSPPEEQHLDFIECLKMINDLAWLKSDAPIFLFLNLQFQENEKLEYQIASQIKYVLAKRLMDFYYSAQRAKIGNILVSKAMNRIIILTNRKPVDSSLNELVNGIAGTISSNLTYLEIDSNSGPYGGIVLKFGSRDQAIQTSKFNLTMAVKLNSSNKENIYNPKIDNKNYDTDQNFDIGISLTFMNWQNIDLVQNPDNIEKSPDTCLGETGNMLPTDPMRRYLARFKNGGMILKTDMFPQRVDLIYKPVPPPPIYQQNPALAFENKDLSGLNGFYTGNI